MQRWGIARTTSAVPTDDGGLPQSAWEEAQDLGPLSTFFYIEEIDGSQVRALAGSDMLHLQMRIPADVPTPSRVEFLLAPSEYGHTYFTTGVDVQQGPEQPVGQWGGTDEQLSPDPVVRTDSDGVVVEVGIEYSAVDDALSAGDEWRLNVLVLFGINEHPALSWSPVYSSKYRDEGNGTLFYQAPVAEEGRLGSIFLHQLPDAERQFWAPQVQLTYTDFLTKQVVASLPEGAADLAIDSVRWKEPGVPWAQADHTPVGQDDDEYTFDLSHPAATVDGSYVLELMASGDDGSRWAAQLTIDREDLIRIGLPTDLSFPPRRRRPVRRQPPSAEVQELLDLIPDLNGMNFCGLPESPSLRPENIFELDPQNRHQLISEHSSMTFPNSTYPEDKALTVTRDGMSVDYPYYEDDEGRQYFFSAHLWLLQIRFVLEQVDQLDLGANDPLGAARVLHAFARAYRTYGPTNDYLWRNYPLEISAGPPYASWGGTWARWSKSELWRVRHLMDAYRLVQDTNAAEHIEHETGDDLHELVVEGMFRPSIEFVESIPTFHYNYANWTGLAALGWAIEEPDHIHRSAELVMQFIHETFLFDGFHEVLTLSYHVQLGEGTFGTLDALEGWSDPDGYTSPRDGQRFADLDLRKDSPIVRHIVQIPQRVVYPDGRVLPIQETWASDRPEGADLASGTWLLPASGIARLAWQEPGSESDAQTTYLCFPGKYRSHWHHDPLNLTLFAHGQELLSDIGYSHTNYRMWTRSHLAHNTVLVDSEDMPVEEEPRPNGGSIESFVQIGSKARVASADQADAYDVTEEFSREVWTVELPSESGQYVVDLFRVLGGSRHEYVLGGDANTDAEFHTDLPMEDYGPYLLPPDVEVIPPGPYPDTGSAEGHYYGYAYVQDVTRGATSEDDVVRIGLTTTPSEPDVPAGAGLAINLVGSDGELFLGRSQSLRATRVHGRSADTNAEAETEPGKPRYTLPKLVLRRDREDLRSDFVTILEPLAPESTEEEILEIEKVDLIEGGAGAVALRVIFADHTDFIFSSPSGERVQTQDATLDGRFGFIRVAGSSIEAMGLADGTSLTYGEETVAGNGAVTGTLVDTYRVAAGDEVNGLVVDTDLTDVVPGAHAIVTHPDGRTHGYLISDVHEHEQGGLLVLGDMDPGISRVADDVFEMMFPPFLSWSGEHTFRISNIATHEA